MDMTALDAEMNDPDPLAHRGYDRGVADRLVDRAATQVADGSDDSQDDMKRVARLDLGALVVRGSRACALRLASCALALTTVAKQLLLYVPLSRPPHDETIVMRRQHVN